MLLCIVLSAIMQNVCAEEFGISRWNTKPIPQQPSQQILPYIVRIIAFDSTGQSFGTGSYVGTYGEYGVILTNWHVIFTEETERLVHVHFPSGFSTFGAIIKSDPVWDLALIAISKPPQTIPMLTVSQTPPKPGDPLWIAGFGSGSYRIAEGRCVRYLPLENPPKNSDTNHEIVEVSVSARKGDSGGPILNYKGELAGVLFGSDMVRNTAGSYCERVNRFLMETQNEMAHLPPRPETHFASKEKEGPLRSLKDSRNIVLPDAAPQRTGYSNPSAASFGVKSSPRRYIPLEHPISNELPQTPKSPSQKRQESAVPGAPLSSRFSMNGVQSAFWADAAPKIGAEIQPTAVIQTSHLSPLEPLMPVSVVSSDNTSSVNRYLLKLSADQHDILFTLFMSLNALAAIGLSYQAVRLLTKR